MISIIEYGAGNQTSVKRALDYLGISNQITSNPENILNSDGIIFPGVGAAAQAMKSLARLGLGEALKDAAKKNVPLLGICLGCQILLEYSEEENTNCLGLLPGICRRFDNTLKDKKGYSIKIPHMGWNMARQTKDDPLWINMPDNAEFYFVHGYYVITDPNLVITTTDYGLEFCSVYGQPGIWGVQFHPEKSGPSGLNLLRNFNEYCQTSKNE